MIGRLAVAANSDCHGFRSERDPASHPLGFYRRHSHQWGWSQDGNSLVGLVLKTAPLIAVFIFAWGLSAQAAMAASVGTITKVENQAQIGSTAAVVGSLVQTNDEVSTGPKSRLEISFRDDTKLTLGENAKVVIDRYVFNPEESTGELVLSTGAAAFRMATGKIGKMQNKKINVSTPFAALAVRGTDFWWGPVDGHSGALLVSNSRLDVRKDECDEKRKETNDNRERCKCAVTLDKAGEGTDIKGGCPGAPYQWPPGKVAAVLSSTSFGLASLGTGLLPAAAAAAGVAGAAAGSIAGKSSPPNVSDFVPPPDNGGGGGGGPPLSP